ncbi:MAG: hypothetical protein N3E47_06220 [Candidatus Bathyarchaeota archaeon]|nr:hypothetical protein [Candidatus Bathyarchaeota archaeon]
MERGFRDRDFIQTIEGFLFCVIGSIHPPDRVISYIKYVPAEDGLWGRGDLRFRRIMRHYTMLELIDTLKFLEQHPEYLYYSHVMGVNMSAVPIEKISFHFKPEEKMRKLNEAGGDGLDPLERKALDLALRISDESGVPLENFGVTGSILLGIHQPFSDIDLTVYGKENSRKVRNTLQQIHSTRKIDIQRFSGVRAEEWCLNKSRLYPLTYEEAKMLLERKWNIGLFQGTVFSLHPAKFEWEVGEKYGDRVFEAKGMVKITATVIDDSESDFMPSKYLVEDVKVLEGPRVNDIREVASYEGLYAGISNRGERIVAYGKLERVFDNRRGEEYHRVLVGSQEARGGDYVKPLL